MGALFRKRTAINFFMLFATSVANRVLVIGRRFAVKSVVGTYGRCEGEIGANRAGFVGLTFECQGEHPAN